MDKSQNVGAVIEAWRSITKGVPQEALDLEVQLQALTVRLLALGHPVSAEQLVESWGLPLEEVKRILKQAEARIEVDENGYLIGAGGLSIPPTRHYFRVNSKTLYAWCALDAIFLPAFLAKTAEVESTDPVNNETIQLTITPDGIASMSPDDIVLSIATPGVSCSYDRVGRGSEVCGQMHFFSSPASAEVWLKKNPGTLMLTVEEAYQVAHNLWLIRLPEELKYPKGQS
ncbi:MAG: organomercurial lyase [Candidatus Hodarchaeales archaeon]|jgi:alkylmercury lyase